MPDGIPAHALLLGLGRRYVECGLLFWLSLFPFVTAWMGEHPFAPAPTYGVAPLLAAEAYSVLQGAILAVQGRDSLLARAVGRGAKGKLSIIFYLTAVLPAFRSPAATDALYALVALMRLIPDRRIERALAASEEESRQPGRTWERAVRLRETKMRSTI